MTREAIFARGAVCHTDVEPAAFTRRGVHLHVKITKVLAKASYARFPFLNIPSRYGSWMKAGIIVHLHLERFYCHVA